MTVLETVTELGANGAKVPAYGDILNSKFQQMRGRLQESWGALTNSEADRFYGRRDQLVGMLQEKYGYTRMQAIDYLGEFVEGAMSGSDSESESQSTASHSAESDRTTTWISLALVAIAGLVYWNKNR